jgi:predicted metal-binding membrane protein
MQVAGRQTGGGLSWALIWCAVVGSWALALTIPAFGHGGALSHDAALGTTAVPGIGSLLLFLVAWQVMTAAMMLPSSLPMVGLFARACRGQSRPGLALVAFLAAYFAVWTGFALLALTGDAALHRLVERWGWLDARPWLVTGSVLVLAGAFQFSPLKERCLDACRTPLNFLWRYYRRGTAAAWALGLRHGLFCLGCCWALMLTMFAVGVGSLVWMAGLTGVMVIEKTVPWGRRLAPLVGAALLAWGGLLLLVPGWLPPSLGGSG